MKLFFTIITFLLSFHSLLAQERTISGRLTSTEDGSPLPGINVSIKGTDIGTSTDANGFYSIRVSIGQTLVFSFIGMQTREVVVTESNLQPINSKGRQDKIKSRKSGLTLKPLPRTLFQDTTLINEIGIAVLTNETPSYNSKSKIDPTSVRGIKQRGNSFNIKLNSDPIRGTGFALQFSSLLGIEQINRLPSFQNQYSQGRTNGNNLQWNGADQSEIFSWGPLLRTLEFDGSDYSFDKNGGLVPSGTGNGVPAKNYDPLSFFRTGIVNVNELMITVPVPKNGALVFDLENRTRIGVIPNSEFKKTSFSVNLKNYKVSDVITANASISFNSSAGTLLQRGANLSSIIGGIYRTPVTFDNTNALSITSARSSHDSYEFSDGTKRSHARGFADNPYGLINELPDNEAFHRLMTTLNLQYFPRGHLSLIFNGNVDQQWTKTIFGTPPGYSGYTNGRLTDRNDDQTFANAILTSAYRQYIDDGELKLSLSYQVENTVRKLNRMDGFNFYSTDSYGYLNNADSIVSMSKNINRTTQEIIVNTQYEYHNWLNIRFANRSYFSNTVSRKKYTNLFPSGSASLDLVNLLQIWNIESLKLYTTVSRTLREAPLLYSNWSYGSINLPIESYSSFYESNELFLNGNVIPETERKFETGIKFRGGRFNVELSYFNNKTSDFIIPVTSSDGIELKNSAAIKNFGGLISAGYAGYMINGSWGIDIKWSKYNSIAEKVQSPNEWIAIAGFQSTQSVLSSGKPVGAIYGTTYTRNQEGMMVIGNDGFPLTDSNLKMIGNPIPDWNLGWSSFIQWKQLKFSFLLDFKKGGEIWNGTNSVLDYLGRSSSTGNLRTTANYVFEGVDISGDPNLIPVNLYDPTKPIADNRWVRYGWGGVGEDYIEDASWIRLSELVFSYSTKQRWNNAKIKSIKFSLIGRNLFLITPYSGVDPAATLFGYSTTNGLDLFNTPSTRSYSAQITFKI